MAFLTRLPALSLFTSLALATSPISSHNLLVHEALDALPLGFEHAGPASPDTTLTLRIALSQSQPDAIVDALSRVSDPESVSFRQYLSKSEVTQLVAPSPDSVSAVNSWLQEHGLVATPISPAGDWLEIHLNVSRADSLLDAQFSKFALVGSDIEAIRTLSYSIPAGLKGHIDLIHPTTVFPAPVQGDSLAKRSFHTPVLAPASSSPCANGTTPACLQKLYNIPKTAAKNSTSRLGVSGRFGNNVHYKWLQHPFYLQEFLSQHRPDMNSSTNFTVAFVDGGNNDQDAPSVSEGELDIQYTVGLATNVPVEYVMVGVKWKDGDLNGWLDEVNYLLSLDKPHQVLTTSYGYAESTMSYALTDKLCKAYAQLGARGVSLLFASGDSGPGCANSNSTKLAPMFPSNCPFVTSVGGTQGFAPEQAWDGSSGGFSNYYPTPSYQSVAVSSYLKKLATSPSGTAPLGIFNRSGRAFPDVAAKADDFRVWEGEEASLYGTSAASPTFASIVALINDRLAQAGKPPLGFLNPWLYKTGFKGLTDITKGASSIDCNGKTFGYSAVQGWDPVTGLGTPDFNKLIKLVGL